MILSHLEVAGSKLWLETIPGSVRANLKRVKPFTNVKRENYSATKKKLIIITVFLVRWFCSMSLF